MNCRTIAWVSLLALVLGCGARPAPAPQAIIAKSAPPKGALLVAARKGDAAAVKTLLDDGVDPNFKTPYGATALTYAAGKGHSEIIRLLIEHKADVNAKDSFYGATPITWAVMNNHVNTVGQLLEAGATGGNELLISAARLGQADLVAVILEKAKPPAETLNSARRQAKKPEVIAALEKAGAKPPESAAAKPAGPPTTPYVGHYKHPEVGEIEIVAEEGVLTLKLDGQTLYTLAHSKDNIFTPEGGNGTLEFKIVDGKATAFVRKMADVSDRTFERFEKSTAGAAAIKDGPEPDGKVVVAADWPQFRGVGASGVADGQFPPTNFDATTGKNIRWKTPIPGLGHSCPVVAGDHIYVTTAVSGDAKATLRPGQYGDVESVNDSTEHVWKVICLDKKTGDVVWERQACKGVPKMKRHLKGTHASSTPATDGERLVVNFGAEGLYCYDRQGNLVWRRDLGTLDSGWFFDPDYQWGFGSSPIVYDGKAIVQCDIGEGSFLAAFSLSDGSPCWQTPREEIPSWGTPTVIVGPTRAEIVTNGTKFARGYDPATGKELWRLGNHSEITVPTPFLAEGLIFVCSGYRPIQPIYAIKPGASGDITLAKDQKASDHVTWSVRKGGPYLPTPIVYDGHLYVCTNAGMLSCLDAKTGKKIYTERVGGAGGYTASLVAADGRIYLTSEEGGVRVVKAGPKYELLAVNPIGEVCMATPAIADGLFLLRTQSHVIAFGR